jgi:hypothetical protein
MSHMFIRFALVGSCVLALLGWCAHSHAATLADWNLGEATNGAVVTSIDSSGHPLRDLRVPGAADGGYVGPSPTYTSFPSFPASDGRGVNFDSSVGLLVTSNKNVFSTSDFSGGFTWEIVYKMSTPLPDGGFRALTSIEAGYELGVLDADPTAGASPNVAFTISGTYSFRIQTPIAIDGQFHHVAGIYDPALSIDGVNTMFLYYDYSLGARTNGFSLYNIDALNDFTSVGGRPSPSNPFSMADIIDHVRISNSILSVGQFIPEPSALMLALVGCGLLVRRFTRE